MARARRFQKAKRTIRSNIHFNVNCCKNETIEVNLR